jgi:hypothetical protein
VFGALKAMCRRLFPVCWHDCEARVAKPDAVAFLREARDRLEARVVEKGRGIYEDVHGQWGDECDSDDDFEDLFGGEFFEELGRRKEVNAPKGQFAGSLVLWKQSQCKG